MTLIDVTRATTVERIQAVAEDPARIDAATDGGPNAPERAAWTLVANALLNLDETFTK